MSEVYQNVSVFGVRKNNELGFWELGLGFGLGLGCPTTHSAVIISTGAVHEGRTTGEQARPGWAVCAVENVGGRSRETSGPPLIMLPMVP